MHSAGCVYGCVYAAGRKQGRLTMIFLPLPVYLKNAEWVPGAAVLEITWPLFLRLGAWGRRAALPGEGWLVNGKYAGVSAPGARCGQPCPPSPTPALGLPFWACVWLPVKLRGGYNVPFHPTRAETHTGGT